MARFQPGPDAARYLLAGRGDSVASPFNLRWLLPAVCGDDLELWRLVWLLSWPVVAAGAFWWAYGMGATPWQSLAAAAFLVALPGVWGPISVRPVGVDLPCLAVSLLSAGFFANGQSVLGVVFAIWAATIKESAPIWIALWAWTPWALVALVAPLVAHFVNRPAIDEVTAVPLLRRVHDHPILSSMEHHDGVWRQARFMVEPWGVTLAALVSPSPQLVAVLAAAYAQLAIATDTVRLYQYAAGPVMALAAAQVIPVQWLLLAAVVGAVWWREPVVG